MPGMLRCPTPGIPTRGGTGYFLETTANYQNNMYIPAEWATKRLFVKFYGVQSVADVFVNGYYVGGHKGGGTAFALEITDKIRFGFRQCAAGRGQQQLLRRRASHLDGHEPLRGHLPRSRADPHGKDGRIAPLPRLGRHTGAPDSVGEDGSKAKRRYTSSPAGRTAAS